MSSRKKTLLLLAWFAGCGFGFLIERSGREVVEPQAPVSGRSQLQIATRPAGMAAAWQALHERPLADRYAAMLALLDAAGSNAEMFRIFEACLPDPYLRIMVAKRWATMDAPGMFDYLLGEGAGNFSNGAGKVLFGVWGGSDPEAALAAIARVGNVDSPNDMRDFQIALFGGWMESDPARALSSELAHSMGFYLKYRDWPWIDENPGAAWQVLLAAPASDLRNAGLSKAIAHLAGNDPQAAMVKLDEVPEELRGLLLGDVVRAWGELDSDAALAFADQNLFGKQRSAVLAALYRERVSADPVAALALLDELAGSSLRKMVAGQIADIWGKRDPRAALAWARDEGGADLARGIEQHWAQGDLQGAAAWMIEAAPGEYSKEMLRDVSSHLAMRDLAGAVDWAVKLPANELAQAMVNVALSGRFRAVPLLQLHLDKIPPGHARNTVLMFMGDSFRAADPDGAKAWIETLSEADQKEANRVYLW